MKRKIKENKQCSPFLLSFEWPAASPSNAAITTSCLLPLHPGNVCFRDLHGLPANGFPTAVRDSVLREGI